MLEELEFKTLIQATIFAIIYGFKNHTYVGSRHYLAMLTLCDVRTVDRALKYLVTNGYLEKIIIKRPFKSYRGYKTVIIQTNP